MNLPALHVVPGCSKPFRLAFVGPGDRFEALDEFDTAEAAMAAKRVAESLAQSISAPERLARNA